MLRKTARDRFTRSLRTVSQWCRLHRHLPVAEQHQQLGKKLRGHYAYYGITGNAPALLRFYRATERVWRQWLDRRSHRARMSWERFWRMKVRYPLPSPRVVHSVYRFAAKS